MGMTTANSGLNIFLTNNSGQTGDITKTGDSLGSIAIQNFATPLLDGGTLTWITGDNAGRSMEIKTYNLSTHAILLWLGALFLLVLAAGAFGGAWLPRAAVAITGAAVLAFALSNPDRRIASRNLEHRSADLGYLAGLSPDALPALASVPEAACTIVGRLGRGDGVVGWNVARERARGVRVAC